MSVTVRRRLTRPAAAALAALLALAVSACASEPQTQPLAQRAATPLASLDDEAEVAVRIYLRSGTGEQAYLEPVTRQLAVTDDLPRKALDLLIAGPGPDDAKGLHAALPPTTSVLHFQVEGETAVVDLSREAISDRGLLGGSSEHELLALGAVANTLTEFPLIDRVRLTVAGGGRDFWGGWGLPELLARDERVIGPPKDSDRLPPVERFSVREQQVGSAQPSAVTVRGVRTVDRVGFLRVLVELGGAEPDEPAPGVPPITAAIERGRLVLRIDDVAQDLSDVVPGRALTPGARPFEALEAERGELPGPLTIAVVPAGNRPFWLHTLPSPTRVALDVRK